MVGKIQFQLFLITKLIKNSNVWWGSTSKGIEFVISISRVQVLHRASSHTSSDLRNTQDKCFHRWNEVKNKFNLIENEKYIWEKIIENVIVI
jgi:hypothetical protein